MRKGDWEVGRMFAETQWDERNGGRTQVKTGGIRHPIPGWESGVTI